LNFNNHESYQRQHSDIISKIHGLNDLPAALTSLEKLHTQTLGLLKKFEGFSSETVQQEAVQGWQKYLLFLTSKHLSQMSGFQAIFRQQKSDPQKISYQNFQPEHLDAMYKGFQKARIGNRYKGADSLGAFIVTHLEEILERLRLKDILNEESYTVITREMFGHFKEAADSFESIITEDKTERKRSRQDIAYVSLLAKKDIPQYIRFADGAQCCLSSNKTMMTSQGYERYMGAAFNDQGLQVFLVHTKDKPIGFVLWHFGYMESDKLIAPSLKLYIATEYQSSITTANVWRQIEQMMRWVGVKKIAQSQRSFNLAQAVPPDYRPEILLLAQIQTVRGIKTTVADLGDYVSPGLEPNQMMTAPMSLSVKDIPPLDDVAASGYQFGVEHAMAVAMALRTSQEIQKIDGREYLVAIMGKLRDVGLDNGLSQSEFGQFLDKKKVTLHVMKPKEDAAYKLGLGVNFGDDHKGRDVYATYKEEGEDLHIYISVNTKSFAKKEVIIEIVAHELYEAFVRGSEKGSSDAIDLELKVNAEIDSSNAWQSQLEEEERIDLGLDGSEKTDIHTRARAFARIIGDPSKRGQGTEYTDFLRTARLIAIKGKEISGKFDRPESGARELDNRKYEIMSHILSGQKPVKDYIGEQLESHKGIIWNYANFSRPIVKTITRILQRLIEDDKIQRVVLPVGTEQQSLLDSYFRTGEMSEELKTVIKGQMFPSGLPEDYSLGEVWVEFLRFVYNHKQEYPDSIEILAHASLNDSPEKKARSVDFLQGGEAGAILLQYYESVAHQSIDAGQSGLYSLVHVDGEMGFVDGEITDFNYALHYLVGGNSDFALPVAATFQDDAIQMMGHERWQDLAIGALEVWGGRNIDARTREEIKNSFRANAPKIDYYNRYQGVVVSLTGEDGDDGDELFNMDEPDGTNSALPADSRSQGDLVLAGVVIGDLQEETHAGIANQADTTNNGASNPGGIDFNLDLLELEIPGQGSNFNLPFGSAQGEPNIDHNFEYIHINDGLMPVIINITPIPAANLPLILGAAGREDGPELSRTR
jgi:hypothetical protein